MKAPATKPTVKLVGRDGNAFSIMGHVKKALFEPMPTEGMPGSKRVIMIGQLRIIAKPLN